MSKTLVCGGATPPHPLILCVFGIHNWKLKEERVHGGLAEFGGYVFFPNTEEIYECECRKRKSIIKDYKGDVIR